MTDHAPMLRVVKGEPTPEELAALVAVVAARGAATAGAATSEPPHRPGGWTSRRATLRRPVHVGPGEWPASGFEAGTRTRADW